MVRVWSKAVWGAAVAFWLMVPVPAAAQHRPQANKVDRALSQLRSAGPQRVIVRTRQGAAAHVRGAVEAHGDRVLKNHGLVNGFSARIHAEDIAALASDPDIESISLDAPVSASTDLTGFLGQLTTTGVLKDTLGLTNWSSGAGVTVAIIDSGLAPLSDFQGRIVGFHDFTNGRNGAAVAPYDDFGHGTHVAGLIGSSGTSSKNVYAGVASRVNLLPLKVLDATGAGYTSDVVHALEFAVANKGRYGIRVINLSLGHPIYESAATDPLVQAVEAAVRSGIVVVVAAGNRGAHSATRLPGYGGIASPGNAPSALTVGAAATNGTVRRSDDRVARFSSRGPSWYDGIAKPDIVAPGHGLVSNTVLTSTLATLFPSALVNSGTSSYVALSGSSMATGIVSGLVAVMIEANEAGAYARWYAAQPSLWRLLGIGWTPRPALTPNAVKAMLQFSATPIRDDSGAVYDALTQGAGLVNGAAAAQLAYSADTTKSVGSFWLAPAQPYTVFDGVVEPWSQSILWGTRLAHGSSLLEVRQPAWADNIVWGTGELDNIVWGTVAGDDNIVWGTALAVLDLSWFGNASFGDNIVWGTAEWADNIVWGTGLLGFFNGDNIVWGTLSADNIVWGTLSDDNIVWGTLTDDNIVWGTTDATNATSVTGGVQ